MEIKTLKGSTEFLKTFKDVSIIDLNKSILDSFHKNLKKQYEEELAKVSEQKMQRFMDTSSYLNYKKRVKVNSTYLKEIQDEMRLLKLVSDWKDVDKNFNHISQNNVAWMFKTFKDKDGNCSIVTRMFDTKKPTTTPHRIRIDTVEVVDKETGKVLQVLSNQNAVFIKPVAKHLNEDFEHSFFRMDSHVEGQLEDAASILNGFRGKPNEYIKHEDLIFGFTGNLSNWENKEKAVKSLSGTNSKLFAGDAEYETKWIDGKIVTRVTVDVSKALEADPSISLISYDKDGKINNSLKNTLQRKIDKDDDIKITNAVADKLNNQSEKTNRAVKLKETDLENKINSNPAKKPGVKIFENGVDISNAYEHGIRFKEAPYTKKEHEDKKVQDGKKVPESTNVRKDDEALKEAVVAKSSAEKLEEKKAEDTIKKEIKQETIDKDAVVSGEYHYTAAGGKNAEIPPVDKELQDEIKKNTKQGMENIKKVKDYIIHTEEEHAQAAKQIDKFAEALEKPIKKLQNGVTFFLGDQNRDSVIAMMNTQRLKDLANSKMARELWMHGPLIASAATAGLGLWLYSRSKDSKTFKQGY